MGSKIMKFGQSVIFCCVLFFNVCAYAEEINFFNEWNFNEWFSEHKPSIGDYQPANKVIFFNNDNHLVGEIDFSGKEMKFTGDCDESAELFFTYCLKNLVDDYLKTKHCE